VDRQGVLMPSVFASVRCSKASPDRSDRFQPSPLRCSHVWIPASDALVFVADLTTTTVECVASAAPVTVLGAGRDCRRPALAAMIGRQLPFDCRLCPSM